MLQEDLNDDKWVPEDEVKALKKSYEKEIKKHEDEIDKLRLTVRDCAANLQTKNKHGRKNLIEYKPKKMKD